MNKKMIHIIRYSLLLTITSSALSAPYPGRLGINIGLAVVVIVEPTLECTVPCGTRPHIKGIKS